MAMKGHMHVDRLLSSGIYVSKLDTDKAFAYSGNTCGYFKMIILPILNSNGQREIRFMKDRKGTGYVVSGEAYIIADRDEKTIDHRCLGYRKMDRESRDLRHKLIQTKVSTKNKLW
jgi:hypothetical protein